MDRIYKNKEGNQSRNHHPIRWSIQLGILLISLGCASTRNIDFQSIDKKVEDKQYTSAYEELESKKTRLYAIQDLILYDIEAGTLAFYNKEYQTAINHFFSAETNIEQFYGITPSERTARFVQNEAVIMYEALRYEQIYVNVFLALAFLAQNQVDSALVEIRKLDAKLRLLEDYYYREVEAINSSDDLYISIDVDAYSPYDSPFARFLGSVLYRSIGAYDDARIDRDALFVAHGAQQGNDKLPSDFSDPSAEDRHAVVIFARKTPLKEGIAVSYRSSDTGYNFYVSDEYYAEHIRAVSTTQTIVSSDGVEPGLEVHFALPAMQERPSQISFIRCYINGELQYDPILLDDLSAEYVNEFTAKYPFVFARVVSSAIAKAIASLAARTTAQVLEDSDNEYALLAWLGSAILDVAIQANAVADIRVSRYFPGAVFAGDYTLRESLNTVRVEYYDSFGALIDSENIVVSAEDALSLYINLK